jgi:hypothetical protein
VTRSTLSLVLGIAGLSATAGTAAAPLSSEAALTVTGGPHAGTHALQVQDVGCEIRRRPGRPKTFNANFGVQGVTDPKKLSFVLVRIRNADAPGGPAPTDFEATATFGPVMGKGETRYLSGKDDVGRTGGPGTVLLKDDGKGAQVTLDLQPQPGVAIRGTVRCALVPTP